MKIKVVLLSFVLDRTDYGFGRPTILNEKLDWLYERNVEIDTVSAYDAAAMCYRVKVIAEFDRETYIENRMVWE